MCVCVCTCACVYLCLCFYGGRWALPSTLPLLCLLPYPTTSISDKASTILSTFVSQSLWNPIKDACCPVRCCAVLGWAGLSRQSDNGGLTLTILEDCAGLEGELRVMLRLTGVDGLGLLLADTEKWRQSVRGRNSALQPSLQSRTPSRSTVCVCVCVCVCVYRCLDMCVCVCVCVYWARVCLVRRGSD